MELRRARRIRFEYPDDASPVWTPGRPEFSCAANAVSLLMPAVEPYFVRATRAALPHLDGELRARTAVYLEQEASHHAQHLRFNQLMVDAHPRLARFERLARRAYRAVEAAGSPAFDLAFAAGSETMAYSAARWAAERRHDLFRGADEVASTLFLWHLAEEVEHKSVAWDVYWQLHGDRPRARLRHAAATATALALMVVLVVTGTTLLLAAERRLHRPLAWFRLTRWSIGFAFELLGNLAVSLLPGHHPDDFADPVFYEAWLAELDHDTATIPLWHLGPDP